MPLGTRPQPPVGTARVALQGTTFGHPWAAIQYLRLTHVNPVTVNDLETILNGMADSWGVRFAPLVTNGVSLATVKASFIKAVDQSLDYVHSEAKPGTNANNLADAAACFVINWSTGEYYRGGHPRTYLPGPPSNAITNGSSIGATQVASMALASQNYLNDVNALTSTNVTQVELGTVRYESKGAWLSPPRFVPFTGGSCRGIIGTQRRRITA